MRNTSIAAYHAIQGNGVLNRKQWQVYDELFKNGPLTGPDLDSRLGYDAHKRLSELEKMGVIVALGTRLNAVSGVQNTIFDVTSHVPTSKLKAKSGLSAADMRRLIKYVEEVAPVPNDIQSILDKMKKRYASK